MKKFVQPKLEVIPFGSENIIGTSGGFLLSLLPELTVNQTTGFETPSDEERTATVGFE